MTTGKAPMRAFHTKCLPLAAASMALALPMSASQSRVSTSASAHIKDGGDATDALASAQKALLEGQADLAATTLKAVLAANNADGHAHLLLCRVWLSEEFAERAAPECQSALANGLANSSEAQDWTGRALGRQAEHAGMISGLKLALEVRRAFETAVALNPASEAASVDLGEYYTAAPAIVGGGEAKALALAARIERALPAVSHRIRAMVAEKGKDYRTAEAEFQAEAQTGANPGAIVDLACFYERRHQEERAAEIARQTVAIDHAVDATVIEAASVLEDVHQTALAQNTMRRYLDRGTHSDAAPVFRVRAMLGGMLARSGDRQSAREQYEQALALASQYKPAQKGLASL